MSFLWSKNGFFGVKMEVFEVKLVKDIMAILEFCQNFISK